jgi:hypothetical protein
LPALIERWSLSATGAAWITGAMQLGFFVGAIAFAIIKLADIWPSPRVFAANAVVGGIADTLPIFPAFGIGSSLACVSPGSVRPPSG